MNKTKQSEVNPVKDNELSMKKIILDAVTKEGKMTTAEAKNILGVSESTIRRLFTALEDEKKVIRYYGGIMPYPSSRYEYDTMMRVQSAEKNDIGKFAASFVRDNGFIYIDCGTTTVYLCEYIVERVKSKKLFGLSVVTNSVINTEILSPYCRTVLAGGLYSPERRSIAGQLCESFLDQFHFQMAFLGADGFSLEYGFSTSTVEFSHLSGIASKHSDRTFILMDSSKFSRDSFVTYDRFEHVNEIITDSGITPEMKKGIEEKGLMVHIA